MFDPDLFRFDSPMFFTIAGTYLVLLESSTLPNFTAARGFRQAVKIEQRPPGGR
jgi:hypothetical protein